MVKKNLSTSAILFKDLLRTLKKDWKQFISIILISLLSTCLFAGLISNANKLEKRANNLYSSCNFADIYVTTNSYDKKDIINLPSQIEEIETIEKRTYMPVDFKKNGINIIVSDSENTLSHPILISGEYGYLAMGKFLQSENLKIGDSFSITCNNFLKNSLLEYSRILDNLKTNDTNILLESKINFSIKITGEMYHPEGVQNSSFSSSLGYMSPEYLKELILNLIKNNYNYDSLDGLISLFIGSSLEDLISSKLDSFSNQYLIKAKNSLSNDNTLEQIRQYYENKKENNLMLATEKEYLESYQMLNQDVTQAGKLPYVFPIIFFLVSALIILTTITQIIIKQRSQIGCLKAIGVPRKNIYIHYMGIGTFLTLFGSLLGMILGPIIIPPVLEVKYNLLWDLPKTTTPFFSWQALLMLISMLLITIICGFFVSRNVIKEKPVKTLRPKISVAQKHVPNPNSFYYKHTSLSLKMALRNISKSKAKTIMVILGTLGCSSLAVCGFGIMDTLNYGIFYDYNANINMKISAEGLENNKNIKEDIYTIEGVEKVEIVSSYSATLISETSYIISPVYLLENNSSYFPAINEHPGLNIDKTTADKLNLKVGDEIDISINSNSYTKKINRIFESSILHGIYDLSANYSENISSVPVYYIYGKKDISNDNLKENLLQSNLFSSINTYDDMMTRAHEIMSSIELMTDVIKIFAILLCIVVIYNLSSLNISERTRDIATMKVLGFKFKSIASTLTIELMVDAVIGGLLGLLFGFPMTYMVLSVNITSLLTFMYHIYWYSYMYGFLVTGGTALVVSLFLNKKIKKVKMVESLKSIE